VGRIPKGKDIAATIASEVVISRRMAEIVKLHEISHQFIGVRRGVLRSQRLILVSPKVGRLIKSEKIRGCRLEVAYFV
jgi:hypothetical protein